MTDNKNKVVGVAVDNYKVNKFTKTIKKKGFRIIDTIKFNKDVQVIQVDCPQDKVYKLGQIIQSLEAFFKQRN